MTSPDKFLEFLDDKLAKICERRQRLDEEEADIERTKKLYLAHGAVKSQPSQKSKEEASVTAKIENFLSGVNSSLYGIHSDATIKQRVISILKHHSKGLTSSQILNALRSSGLPELERESLSPQLSRLKEKDSLVNLNDGIWSLNGNGGASDANPSV